jgi:hypothetical protein
MAARLVTLKASVPSDEWDGFYLLGSDFLPLHSTWDQTDDLHWPAADVVNLQWLKGLVWERNSLADSNGTLRPWMLLLFVGGPYFTTGQLSVGSSFHRNMMTATAWVSAGSRAQRRVSSRMGPYHGR